MHPDTQFFRIIILQGILLLSNAKLTNKKSFVDNRHKSYIPKEEIAIPVLIWDSFNNPVVYAGDDDAVKYPPRYVIGSLGVAPSSIESASSHLRSSTINKQFFTFDLGNPGESILTVEECLGCLPSDTSYTKAPKSLPLGCPDIVPSCDSSDTTGDVKFCWPSHTDEYLPGTSYEYLPLDSGCPDGKNNAGYHHSSSNDILFPVCSACYDGGNHSRFFVPAKSSELLFLDATHSKQDDFVPVSRLPDDFLFGALIRTVPLVDRLWSNMGIGRGSHLLRQLGVTKYMLTFPLKETSENKVIFLPDIKRYEDAPCVHFGDKRQRNFNLSYFDIGGSKAVKGNFPEIQPVVFMLDTGNDGIYVHDLILKSKLAEITGGVWRENITPDPANYGPERLYIARGNYSPKDLTVAMEGKEGNVVEVVIPANRWIVPKDWQQQQLLPSSMEDNDDYLPTIFVTDTKNNILGMPFLSAPGVSFVFDDDEQNMYMPGAKESNYATEEDLLVSIL